MGRITGNGKSIENPLNQWASAKIQRGDQKWRSGGKLLYQIRIEKSENVGIGFAGSNLDCEKDISIQGIR